MIKPVKQPKKQSFRFRIIAIVLVLIILSIAIIAYLGVNAISNAGKNAQISSENVIRAQGQGYMMQIIAGTARQNDLILERIGQDARYLASYTQEIFNDPNAFADTFYWNASDRMVLTEDGRFINDSEDIASVYVPNFAAVDEGLIQALNLSAHVDHLFRAVFENNPNVVAIYLGTEQEITRYFPNIGLGDILPADFQVTQRPWYTAAVADSSQKGVTWSPIYEDSTGKGFLVTAAVPVYTLNNELIGVIGIDVTLEEISQNVAETQLAEGGYSFLLDENGSAITLPDQGYRDILNREKELDELGPDLTRATSPFQPIVDRMVAGEYGFKSISLRDDEYFVAYAPLENTGWSLGSIIPAQELLRSIPVLGEEIESTTQKLILTRILPFSAILLIAAILVGLVATNRLSKPLQELVTAAQHLGSGEWDTPLPGSGIREIATLTESFRSMADQLQQNISNLEARVTERTASLERRSHQFQTAADVGSAVATIRDLDSLLSRVTQTISESFGFYHVGIFLFDEKKEFAVFKSSNSEGGKRMLARGHQLRVGEEGIVGFVAASGEPRIALDVGADAIHFRNPDLPETRSELAMPLFAGGELLGVLDVQSTKAAAFSEEDIAVLQVLANLVAVAIENAQLFEENQIALETAQRLTREVSGEAWKDLLSTKEILGFRTDPSELITPTSGKWSDDMIQAAQESRIVRYDDYTVTVPIILRDQVLGAVRLKKNKGDGIWRKSEIELMDTLVDQLETALESARLYMDSQRQATRERLVTEITTKLRGSMDPQTILNTAVTELKEALNAQRAQVLVKPNPD